MKTERKKVGFTITELLTVMAVIAMLLGILVPALNLVRKLAKDTNQRAQLHGIDVGLETFSNDNDGYYPDSAAINNTKTTVGAQRLAEALVGRDLLGFDPNTTWDAEYDSAIKTTYASTKSPKTSSQPQVTASLSHRQGPYLDVTKTEAFQLCQLYTGILDAGNIFDGNQPGAPAPVLTDTYRVKRVVMGGKTVMAGTPILYYKANAMSLTFPDVTDSNTISDVNDCGDIYCSHDNQELIDLYQMMKPQVNQESNMHLFDSEYQTNKGIWNFYDKITNKQITSQPRPYNATTYILMSAGYDGVFGTRDDIYNFD